MKLNRDIPCAVRVKPVYVDAVVLESEKVLNSLVRFLAVILVLRNLIKFCFKFERSNINIFFEL